MTHPYQQHDFGKLLGVDFGRVFFMYSLFVGSFLPVHSPDRASGGMRVRQQALIILLFLNKIIMLYTYGLMNNITDDFL